MSHYLVTGGSGFIGSHLVHALLNAGHQVRVLDDFSTGRRENLATVSDRIECVEGTVLDAAVLSGAMRGIDYCLHQAAIPSVPRSIAAPDATNDANVTGTLRLLLAAREQGVHRVVFASSSSVYGRAERYPVDEGMPRVPLSPYGASKAAAEMYAEAFSEVYGMEIVGLRYFNVFGPRQDPASAYAAVIPKFITAMLRGEAPVIHGDGTQSRDFSYIDNVVAANLRACAQPGELNGIFNVACGQSVSLKALVAAIN